MRGNELQVYTMLKLIRDINALTRTASWEMGARSKDFAFITLFGKGDWCFIFLEAVKKRSLVMSTIYRIVEQINE